jgi:hypothetical protein
MEDFRMQLSDLRRTDRRTLGAAALIILGLLLFFSLDLWPLFIILPGLALLSVYYAIDHEATGPFAIPGMIVTGTGLILFIHHNLIGNFWSYAWTLYGVFFGLGMILMGQRFASKTSVEIGRGCTVIGGMAFLALGAIFFIFSSFFLKLTLTLILIAAGVYLLFGRDNDKPKKKRHSDSVVDENIEQVRLNGEREVA